MADSFQELQKQMQRIFNERYKAEAAKGKPLYAIRRRMKAGTATLADANKYAQIVGEITSQSLKSVLSESLLADTALTRELAEATIGSSLKNAHLIVSDVTAEIQKEMLQAQGVGINPINPKVNNHRLNKLIKSATEAPANSPIVANIIDRSVINFSQAVVDESIKANTKFQQDAGLQIRIVRTYDGVGIHGGKPCQWCLSRQGTWTYSEAMKHGVFQRHEGCGCIIEYQTEKSSVKSNSRKSGWN